MHSAVSTLQWLYRVGGRRWLDTEGIERWLLDALTQFAQCGPVAAIVPVAHGAAAALVRDGRLACLVSDYEDPIPGDLRVTYDAQRDSFALTGSPALPDGLNLGAQLYRLEQERPELLSAHTCIIPWPQYWGWRLSGVAASEVSSLGCHTDLWRPGEGGPSSLARTRGWAQRLAPLRRAQEMLGQLREDWAARTGLSNAVQIYCGLHDSNAALLAARAFPQVAGRETTVVSTGTWFVAMRMSGMVAPCDLAALPESRDCLVNVDVEGRPVPSARFMGGRELELIGGLDVSAPAEVSKALSQVIETRTMALPGWVPGVGPYPQAQARWSGEPRGAASRAAAGALYAALMTDASLDLIGGRERVIIEGRFASVEVFVRALAALRPDTQVLINNDQEGGVPFGALRLVDPTLAAHGSLQRVSPLGVDLSNYKLRWREAAEAQLCAA